MRDVSNRRACKLTITRSNYRGLGHFFLPLFFSLSRFTCIESGKLRNAFNRKMTKQFSLALLMNENKQGQVCVYILLICAGCEIIRWPRWVEHTISNRLLRAERMSPTYTAIVADIEQTIFAGACKLSESLHVTKTCHLFTNISDLNDYVYVNMCIENDFKRNIAPSNQCIVQIFTVQ